MREVTAHVMAVKPPTPAPLDPGFRPAVLANREYVQAARASARAVPAVLGLEREAGLLSRYETVVDPAAPDTFRYIERIVKFLLWARGGWRVYFGGPASIGEQLRRCYAPGGGRGFDFELMGRVYEKPLEVVVTRPEEVPAEREQSAAVGGHLDGCRIGFDLGASDYKVAAVQDGACVYSEEFPWDPRTQKDPAYHFDHLMSGLKKAAAHLPRVDAIGGSSAGVIIKNQIMVASLFRSVPPSIYAQQVQPIFRRVAEAWGVPVEVANDGDVTALAGAMSLGANAMLGIAMGSSQAAGYLDAQGRILGWLNELAFAPVDVNPEAAADEWSGDRGVGAQYFSQQAVNKLLPAAGLSFPKELGLPERLKAVQELMAKGDDRAKKIYETIGVYLGYAIPHYAEFYDYRHMLVLGRVTSGQGGDVVMAEARRILAREFPGIAERIAIHVPDEKSRRVGQAVAAASLPAREK